MHIGLVMECYYRFGLTQGEAFDEAFATAATAEELGFDGLWLAELHFATPVGNSGGMPKRRRAAGYGHRHRSDYTPGRLGRTGGGRTTP